MLIGWALAAIFFLAAAAVWISQIVQWLRDGVWPVMTPTSYFGGTPQVDWVGAERILSFTYDINLGLLFTVLALLSAELGLFLESRIANGIGEGLKQGLAWPYIVAASTVLALVVGALVAVAFNLATGFTLDDLPRWALIVAYLLLAAVLFVALRRPLSDRLR